MAMINCYQCFARFAPRRIRFRCVFHDPPRLIDVKRQLTHSSRSAVCHIDNRVSTYRVCPNCHSDLPHYAGRAPQRIVAVSGCSGSGKSIYQWSLLHQLRSKLTQEDAPFAIAMFEDDRSFREYGKLHETIVCQKLVPEFTQVAKQKRGEYDPIIVRLLCQGKRFRRDPIINLILYDHGGELLDELQNVRYLRYLAHAAGLIYLVDPQDDHDRVSEGLNAIINELRAVLNVRGDARIPIPLAIAINKADISIFLDVFPSHDMSYLLPGHGAGAAFWDPWTRRTLNCIRQTSNHVSSWARDKGFDNLVNLAELNFQHTAFFAVSSLGEPPNGEHLSKTPVPIGVEHPLFWNLQTIR